MSAQSPYRPAEQGTQLDPNRFDPHERTHSPREVLDFSSAQGPSNKVPYISSVSPRDGRKKKGQINHEKKKTNKKGDGGRASQRGLEK